MFNKSTTHRPIIWNYGGGVQSVAIGVLIALGRLPVPERAVIADTSREATSTWIYLRDFMQPFLDSTGLTIEIARHNLSSVDMYPKDKETGEETNTPLIPAYTRKGALSLFCSGEWKRAVVNRWLREPERGFGRSNPVIQWFGISRDEKDRFKVSKKKWIEFQYPLIELLPLPMNRVECEQLIASVGLPSPEKSACWCCPFRNNAEWRYLRDHQPADFQKAIEFDEYMRNRDEQGALYLHRDRVPLADANLDANEKPLSAFYQNECATGYCMV